MKKENIQKICNELNELRKEYNPYDDENKKIEIKKKVIKNLNLIPVGIELGQIFKKTVSYYTSYGRYNDEYTEPLKYTKLQKNKWSSPYSNLKDADDMALSVLYNSTDIMLYEEAKKKAIIERLKDETHFTSYANKETGELAKSEHYFSNLIPSNEFTIEDTGGHVLVAFGKLTSGNYYALSDDVLAIYDDDYYKKAYLDDSVDDYDFYTRHLLKEYDFNSKEYKQMLSRIYENCDENSKQLPLFSVLNKEQDKEIGI